MTPMNPLTSDTLRLRAVALCLIVLLVAGAAMAQRRVTPVRPVEPGTVVAEPKDQPIDPSRLVTTTDARGNTVTVDTVTGREYVDSTLYGRVPPMEYPLIYEASAGVNFWDLLMRAFGQKYGLADVWAELNMHNRYFATIALGMGNCHDTPVNKNYTFQVKPAPYIKIGARYNFFYNSNPDYKLLAGVRYGISHFKWSATDVTVDEGYWGTPIHYSLTDIPHTSGWLELSMGLRVKLWRCISAGWDIVYHSVLHDSRSPHGQPMYIPGFGKRGAITGQVSVVYTIPLNPKTVVTDGDTPSPLTHPHLHPADSE